MSEDNAGLETENQGYTFKNRTFDLIDKLVKADAISVKESEGWINECVVNTEKAEEILSPFVEPVNRAETTEIEKHEAENALRKSVKALVDRDIISTDIAIAAGKIIRPSDIDLKDDGSISFTFEGSVFPATPEGRGVINAGKEGFFNLMDNLRDDFKELGIEVTEGQLKEIALRVIFTHEYGHAVDRALITQETESQLNTDGGEEKPVQVHSQVELKHHGQVFTDIAPEPELAEIFPVQDAYLMSDGRNTSSERIAAGFEELGLVYALEDLGIPKDKIPEILSRYKNDEGPSFKELKQMFELAEQKGVDIDYLAIGCGTLSRELVDKGRDDLADLIPPNVGATLGGYFFPLTETQLKDYIGSFNTEVIKTE